MSQPHDDIRELLLPYSLDLLEPGDRARVEQALAADPALRSELASVEDIGAQLVGGVELTPAPPQLRGRVLAAIQHGVAHDDSDVAATAAPIPITSAPSRRRFRFAMPALAGGLAAACIALAVVSVSLRSDLDSARDRADRLAAEADGKDVPPGLDGATHYAVSTNSGFAKASGSLIQVSKDKWILLFNDVPAPGVGKSWQVWTADSNGLIQNVAQWSTGSTQLIVLDRADIKEVMVSYEPTTRPAPVPSSAPVADVKV
jgi:hypothetical protein